VQKSQNLIPDQMLSAEEKKQQQKKIYKLEKVCAENFFSFFFSFQFVVRG
jgi:hypothetical protein